MQLRRWHHVLLLLAEDSLHQRALFYVARHDRGVATFQFCCRAGVFVEAQAGLAALSGVGTVASEATVGEDRAHLAIEVHRGVRGQRHNDAQQAEQRNGACASHKYASLNATLRSLSNRDSNLRSRRAVFRTFPIDARGPD